MGTTDERGATMVQYVLMIAFLSLVVVLTGRGLGGSSASALESAGGGVASTSSAAPATGPSGSPATPTPTTATTATTAAPSSPTPAPTTPVATAPVTTAPITTAPIPAPASTATTTPATTVTTTAAAPKVSSGFTGTRATSVPGGWVASTVLTVSAADGTPVSGAVATLTVRMYTRNGSQSSWAWQEQVVVVATLADGSVPLSTVTLKANGGNDVTQVQFVLTGAQLPGSRVWDQQRQTATVDQPS